jgi:serine/threonine protein kinase
LKDCNDTRELERILLHSIEYIAEIHNKNMFHGDIKPANIFYDEEKTESSDSGSLV